MATRYAPKVQEGLRVLNSKSDPPALFNGIPRLYVSSTCAYAQRVWIARNYKGLENIELVGIDLYDKPSWYLEKVYPTGKVPALEHDGKIIGESLDLLRYLDKYFDGPQLFPRESAKQEAAKELMMYTDEVNKRAFTVLRNKEATIAHIQELAGPAFDHLEASLNRFNGDGIFFLGQISGVDMAYIPFIDRFQLLFQELLNYDILENRHRLAKWFEAMNQEEAYVSTKGHRDVILEELKRVLGW